MGHRPNVAIGYGIITNDVQKRKIIEKMDVKEIFLTYLEKAYNNLKEKIKKNQFGKGKRFPIGEVFLLDSEEKRESYYYNHICSPNDRNTNFFGWIAESVYGNRLAFLLYYLLNIEYGIDFEHKLPIANTEKPYIEKKYENSNDKKNKIYFPNQDFFPMEYFVEFASKKGIKELEPYFRDEENLYALLEEYEKNYFRSIRSIDYEIGQEIVNVIFPNVERNEIDRYIIGYYT